MNAPTCEKWGLAGSAQPISGLPRHERDELDASAARFHLNGIAPARSDGLGMSASFAITIEAAFRSFKRLPKVIDQEERILRHAPALVCCRKSCISLRKQPPTTNSSARG